MSKLTNGENHVNNRRFGAGKVSWLSAAKIHFTDRNLQSIPPLIVL